LIRARDHQKEIGHLQTRELVSFNKNAICFYATERFIDACFNLSFVAITQWTLLGGIPIFTCIFPAV